jgi:hypothetical protein
MFRNCGWLCAIRVSATHFSSWPDGEAKSSKHLKSSSLSQVIADVTWNVVTAYILHRVNNAPIMVVGMIAYLARSFVVVASGSQFHGLGFGLPVFGIHLSLARAFTAMSHICKGLAEFSVPQSSFEMLIMADVRDASSLIPTTTLAGGIFNMLIWLGIATALGKSTVVFTSIKVAL